MIICHTADYRFRAERMRRHRPSNGVRSRGSGVRVAGRRGWRTLGCNLLANKDGKDCGISMGNHYFVGLWLSKYHCCSKLPSETAGHVACPSCPPVRVSAWIGQVCMIDELFCFAVNQDDTIFHQPHSARLVDISKLLRKVNRDGGDDTKAWPGPAWPETLASTL